MSKPKIPDFDELGNHLVAAARKTNTHYFTVERETIQPGKTFSREAMDNLFAMMDAWVEARILVRWNQTGEPPSALKVSVTVDAQ